MRTLFTTLLIVMVLYIGNTQSKVTAFTHVNVIPMTGETLLPDYTVLIKDGKVFKMAPSSKLKVKKKAKK
nr:amidohydrolase [Haliscomenobacter sp.]